MLKRIVPTATAIILGFLVLFGSLFQTEALVFTRIALTQWAMVLGAFAFILAYLNLLRVHLSRLQKFNKGSITSLLVIVAAVGSLTLVLWQGPFGIWSQHLLNDFLVPGESALLALTAVTLIISGMRLLSTRRNLGSILFIVFAIIFLLGSVPYIGILRELSKLAQIPALAGMRGILLGVTLGITLTGLRIIFGVDHPHSDE